MRSLVLLAALLLSSPSLAFDGNDRILSIDKYQGLEANSPYDVAEYRPYGSQVQSDGAFTQLGQAIDSLFEPDPPTYYYAGQAYRPLDGTPRNSSYYLRAGSSYGYRPPYRPYRESYRPRDVACRASVSAATALPRLGLSGYMGARASATRAWEKTVSAIHGSEYARFSSARNKRWDCDGGMVAKCQVTATPCRSY